MIKDFNIKEYAVLLIVLLASYLLCFLMPGLGLAYMILMSACICAIGMSFGMLTSVLSSCFLVLVNIVLSFALKAGVESALSPVVFVPAIAGAIGAFCFRSRFSLAKTTILISVSVGVGIMLPLFILNQFFVSNFIPGLRKELVSYLYQILNEMGKSLNLDSATTEAIKSQYYNMIVRMLPAIAIVMCALLAFVFPYISRAYCRRRGRVEYDYMTPFILIKSDKLSAAVPIISIVLAFIITNGLNIVFFNLALICGAGMVICGLSVVSFFIKTLIKRWSVRFLIYLLIFFIPSALLLLALLGVVDAFFNLRHIKDRGDYLG